MPLVDPDLQQYLKQQLANGYTKQQLIPVLKQSQWSDQQINDAFASLEPSIQPEPSSSTTFSPSPSPTSTPTINDTPATASTPTTVQPDPANDIQTTQTYSASSKPSAPRKLLPVIFGMIILAILGGGGIWAYFNIWLSSERILFQTLNNHLNIKSYSYSGEVTANITVTNPELISQNLIKTEQQVLGLSTEQLALGLEDPSFGMYQPQPKLPENLTFGIKFSGKTDNSADNWQDYQSEMSLELVAQGLQDFIDLSDNLSIDGKSQGSTFYIKFNNIPEYSIFNFQKLNNQWIKIDPQQLQEIDGLQTDTDINSEIEQYYQQNQELSQQLTELLTEYPIVTVTDQLPSQTKDQVDTYHYRFEFDEIALANYLVAAFKIVEQQSDSEYIQEIDQQDIDELTQQLIDMNLPAGEIWIGKPDKLIRELKFVIDIEETSQQPSDDYDGQVIIDFNFSNYQQPQQITMPDQYLNIKDIFEKFKNGEYYSLPGNMFITEQFSAARDGQRLSDLYTITNAVYQYAVEHEGQIPDNITDQPSDIGSAGINLRPYLVPDYLADIPLDPLTGTSELTGYLIFTTEEGRMKATATGENKPVIQVTR